MELRTTGARQNHHQFSAIYRVALLIAFADATSMQAANFMDIGAGDSDGLLAASTWLEGAILGTVGTVIVVIAVVGLGFALLTGRMTVKTTMRITIGCFLLFGAQALSRGMLGLTQFHSPEIIQPQPVYVAPETPRPPQPAHRQSSPFDPYTAGSNAN